MGLDILRNRVHNMSYDICGLAMKYNSIVFFMKNVIIFLVLSFASNIVSAELIETEQIYDSISCNNWPLSFWSAYEGDNGPIQNGWQYLGTNHEGCPGHLSNVQSAWGENPQCPDDGYDYVQGVNEQGEAKCYACTSPNENLSGSQPPFCEIDTSCPAGHAFNNNAGMCETDADVDGVADSQDSDGGTGEEEQTGLDNQCEDIGKIYENGQCVDECSYINFGGTCVDPPVNDPQDGCTPQSSNYVGVSPVDNKPYCHTPDPKCNDGGRYGSYSGTYPDGSQISFNGCMPADAGKDLPTCDIATVQVGGGGFACANPAPDTDKDGIADNRESDTDGDGVPDSHDSDVDGDGIANESDPDYKGPTVNTAALEGAVVSLEAKNQAGFNQVANKVGDNTKAIEKQTKAINLGLGTANQHLDQIKKNTGDVKTLITDGTGAEGELDDSLAPDISVTSTRIWTSISTNPTISHYMAIPTISEVNTCPTWTIPSTDYWSAMPFDFHCSVLADIQGVFSALMIGVWTLLAGMLFLKA